MAGLVPAIREPKVPHARRLDYILTNRPNGILYVGVTNDLVRRVWEYREDVIQVFTKRYGLKPLVYFEQYDDIQVAIQRERNVKHRRRTWKVRLMLAQNPQWHDLWESIASCCSSSSSRFR